MTRRGVPPERPEASRICRVACVLISRADVTTIAPVKYKTVFELISKKFHAANISFVLVGGFAINYYGVTRATADIDFVIAKEDYKRAFEILGAHGYKENVVQELFARLGSDQNCLMDVDLIFLDRETLNGLIEEGKKMEIDENVFIVPSLNHLIALKLHAMKNNPNRIVLPDFSDVVLLMETNNVSAFTDKFKELCLDFGTPELHRKILEYFSKKQS